MPGIDANGSGVRLRAGAGTLLLLSDPTNVLILREIAENGPSSPGDISGESGDSRTFDLTDGGREQLVTGTVLERWLAQAPGGPILFGSANWQMATRTLVAGWSATVVHRVAERPRSFEELQREIGDLDAATLERLLAAMYRFDLLDETENDYGEALYAPTQWLREAIVPIALALRGERRHIPAGTPPVTPLDVVACFRLALPLVPMPYQLSGSCRLSVTLTSETGLEATGVIATVGDGAIAVRSVRLDEETDAWVSGDRESWSQAAIDDDANGIVLGGDKALASAVLSGFHSALFAELV